MRMPWLILQWLFWSLLPERETIGAPDCPLMERWTFWDDKRLDCKAMVHHFLPNAADPDCHDHPRPFITFVLRGRYDDVRPCLVCGGDGAPPSVFELLYIDERAVCSGCRGTGKQVREIMRAGMLRRRPANHRHLTRTDEVGAWTVVLMGPKRRAWGFIREGQWWPFKRYEARFGFHMRCESESGELVRSDHKPTMAEILRASEAL